jgi:hypothetical protein
VSGAKKFKGYWWLPSDPQRQWFGNLRWRPSESPELDLYYRTVDEATGSPPLQAESVLGLDEGGTPISVLRLGASGGLRSGFLSERNYNAGHVLKGIHVTNRDGFRIHRLNASFQHLGAWLREEGFKAPSEQEDEFNIQYRRPPDRSFEISKGVTIYLYHSARSSFRNRQRKIAYDIFFAISKKHSFSWMQAFRSIDALRNLLHFACLRPVKSIAVTFENLDHTFELGHKRHPKEIHLLNAGIERPSKENLHETDFVFMFEDVKTRFATLCADWFRFCIEQREGSSLLRDRCLFQVTKRVRSNKYDSGPRGVSSATLPAKARH